MRKYSELITLQTFKERFEYLKLDGVVGADTFGYDRILNQVFYRSPEWRSIRDQVIVRDMGCDLGLANFEIYGRIYVHHMNPITADDIMSRLDDILNPEYLICCSHDTHNAIHYGNYDMVIANEVVERKPNDTCPWRK